MKVLTIVGARPQFIKAATVSHALAGSEGVEERIVHTGQHYDESLSAVFFSELGIPEPAYNLGIGSLPHGAQTGRMLEGIETVILSERPDWVLVYGDTNSTLAGALAAAKLHVPVAHVEAGLRSFNRRMPEEINRILTDHASTLLFTPTETADANLEREGFSAGSVYRVGDVMYDAALRFGEVADLRQETLVRLGLLDGPFVLATVHRAENTDDPRRLSMILAALERLGDQVRVVLPLHPRTRAAMAAQGFAFNPAMGPGAVDPLGYLDMLLLERHAALVVTDSGGVQKEAYFAGTRCVTLRDETEWTELLDLGWNQLLPPTDASSILEGLVGALRSGPGRDGAPFGKGDAAGRIAEVLLKRRQAESV